MNVLKTRFAIDDFILEMLQVPSAQLQLAQLQDWVSRLELSRSLFEQHVAFDRETYQRRLVCRTPCFDMLILGWQPGQASSIHDHQESLNVTRVYRGQLTSRCFAATHPLSEIPLPNNSSPSNPETAKALSLSRETYLETNDLAVVNRHEIHQLANTSTENLVTLHVYARPLQTMSVYCPRSGKAEQIAVQHSLN